MDDVVGGHPVAGDQQHMVVVDRVDVADLACGQMLEPVDRSPLPRWSPPSGRGEPTAPPPNVGSPGACGGRCSRRRRRGQRAPTSDGEYRPATTSRTGSTDQHRPAPTSRAPATRSVRVGPRRGTTRVPPIRPVATTSAVGPRRSSRPATGCQQASAAIAPARPSWRGSPMPGSRGPRHRGGPRRTRRDRRRAAATGGRGGASRSSRSPAGPGSGHGTSRPRQPWT
jgi:hypothetical protein